MTLRKSNSTMSIAVAMVLTPPLIFVTTALRGWAIAKLWLWFVVPSLAAAPLSVAHACGLSVIATMLLARMSDTTPTVDEDHAMILGLLRSAVFSVVVSLICVFVGAMVRCFT